MQPSAEKRNEQRNPMSLDEMLCERVIASKLLELGD